MYLQISARLSIAVSKKNPTSGIKARAKFVPRWKPMVDDPVWQSLAARYKLALVGCQLTDKRADL